MKNFIKFLWKFFINLKNFRNYYRRKGLRQFCRIFLKICGKFFRNIWNYFTNLENLVIFCWGDGARGECKKVLHIVEKISENEYIFEEV